MIITGTGIAFLLLVGIGAPYAAWQSARRVPPGVLRIRREALFAQVIATHVFLFAIAWFTAWQNHIVLWRMAPRPLVAWPAAAILLAAMVLMLKLRWNGKSAAQKARLASMLPQNGRERVPYGAVCLSAGFAEEIVYRGVFTMLVTALVHSLVIAAFVSAIAFALAHLIQGWRAVSSVFLIALAMQAFVAFAASLVPAMAVHALYDFIAGLLVPRWCARDAAQALPAEGAPYRPGFDSPPSGP